MNNYLILVKHSLPEVVESLPAREWKLSDEGRVRAQRLAKQLSRYQPEVIVSSVEPKAIETAEIVANSLRLVSHVMDGLHEHDRSKTPYLSSDEFKSTICEFFEKPDMLVFGSESANQSHERFYQAVHSVLNSQKDKTIIVVAHGTVISLFVSRLIGVSDFSLWSELGSPSFVLIGMQSNTFIVKENVN
jgi:broad specificity phosphatase PhoE